MDHAAQHHFSQKLFASKAPFSHFAARSELGFTAGIIGQDPQHGRLVADGAAQQCTAMLENLATLLGEVGLDFSDIVKTTIYLADYEDFEAINDVYAQYFHEPYPARTTIAAASLPLGAKVQIDAVVDLSAANGAAR